MKSRKNSLRISHTEGMIIMDRTFAKNSENTMSSEYAHLQQVRRDYPNYKVVLRTIRKNNTKNSYCGLTYERMYEYISVKRSLSPREKEELSDKLSEMIQISKCQSLKYRYPVIKKWFLETFPEIKQFAEIGVAIEEEEKREFEAAPASIEELKIAS